MGTICHLSNKHPKPRGKFQCILKYFDLRKESELIWLYIKSQ